MAGALVIRVRFHEGRYHGSGGWPPAPARLYQALVAGVAAGGRLAEANREALAWLELQDPPVVLAPPATPGQGFNTYVPNNDLDAVPDIETVAGNPAGYIRRKDGWAIAASTIRAGKTVRPWLFNAERPLVYLWLDVTDEPERARLPAIALGLYQLGRGIDPAWAEAALISSAEAEALIAEHDGRALRPGAAGPEGVAVPERGSLASLEARHAAFLGRFRQVGTGRSARTSFTNPPKPRFRQVRYDAPPRQLLFDLRWPDGRFHAVPPARAGQLVRHLIELAAGRLKPALPAREGEIERFLVGRGAGAADLQRRVRVFALPTLRAHVDRAIRRVAIEIPAHCPLDWRDIAWAFSGLSPLVREPDAEAGAPILIEAEDRSMLDRYCRADRLWRSETPLALPAGRRRIDPARREPKPGVERLREDYAAAAAVLTALRQAGIGERSLSIRVQREPFAAQGAWAEAFAEGTRFSKTALWHVELGFAATVKGPLILGDGRFCGLGLMRPAERPPGAYAFALPRAFDARDAAALACALRRAVMARVRDEIGNRELPAWFTGHAPDGEPLRDGTHRHLAFAVDPEGRRLLVIPPHLVGRTCPSGEDRSQLRQLERALVGLSLLRAGRLGALELLPVAIADEDPLFAPARIWRSVTAYQPTRHAKRDHEAAIIDDIRAEAARRGLPRPDILALEIEPGPRGGLSVRAGLRFARAVAGPVLLGRTLHKGGGLFVGERERT
ncbi:type I-G CRISPR-associated protein Csb2 [Propylenella binzhouense]|uniref:Type I-U CRISPR-associated protein Cas5/Cas6 n=1 Tax=Propylenella binzhouense TaxID=2555902 RepID=A0A964WSA8_9HYPH|nr:type I-U CRISPR-associated protein Cas5/Cas6 [Propylenella binzhouense]